jgi:hypothetical protein
VLGLAGELGVIAPGYRADIALINTRGLEWRPRGDVFSHLVMYETGANVRDVIVAGTPVLRDGRAVAVNEEDLLAEAEALLRTEAPANAPHQAQTAAERPAFAALIEAALREPTAAERFVRLI